MARFVPGVACLYRAKSPSSGADAPAPEPTAGGCRAPRSSPYDCAVGDEGRRDSPRPPPRRPWAPEYLPGPGPFALGLDGDRRVTESPPAHLLTSRSRETPIALRRPYCTQCGAQLDADDRFCRECGAAVKPGAVRPAVPVAVPVLAPSRLALPPRRRRHRRPAHSLSPCSRRSSETSRRRDHPRPVTPCDPGRSDPAGTDGAATAVPAPGALAAWTWSGWQAGGRACGTGSIREQRRATTRETLGARSPSGCS